MPKVTITGNDTMQFDLKHLAKVGEKVELIKNIGKFPK